MNISKEAPPNLFAACMFGRATIKQLEDERREILKDMRLVDSMSNKNKDERNTDDLTNLGQEKSKLSFTNYNYNWGHKYMCLKNVHALCVLYI